MTQTLKQATKRIKIPGIEKKHPIKNDAIVKKEKKLQYIVRNFKNNYIYMSHTYKKRHVTWQATRCS